MEIAPRASNRLNVWGALQTIIIRGPKQSLSGEAKAFGLKLVEVLTVHGGVTLIKIIARLLDFVLMVDLAVGHMLVPLDVIDGIFPCRYMVRRSRP